MIGLLVLVAGQCSSPFTFPPLFIFPLDCFYWADNQASWKSWIVFLSADISHPVFQIQKNLSPTLPLIRSDLHNCPCPRRLPLTTSETCSIWLRCVKSPSSQLFFFKPFHEPPCCKIHSQEEEVHYILASENGKIATTGKMWEIGFFV